MATFRKRGDKWICEISVKGTRKSKTFDSKLKAKNWAATTEHELRCLADGVSEHHTLADVFDRYGREVSDLKKGARWEFIRLDKFCTYDLAKVKLIDLRREHIEDWMELRTREGLKPSSINRELNLLSHCLTQARRWRLMNHNPMEDLKRPRNPPHRDRRISQPEIDKILISLNYAEHAPILQHQQRVAVAFLFAIETAMRASEICGILHEHVNIEERTVFLPDSKNGAQRWVPLSQRAIELLEKLKPYEAGKTLFVVRSGVLSTLFKKGVGKTGIENLTFHDTRHEAITRLAAKLDVLDLARMVGHRDIKQLTIYYNKSASELAKLL